MTYTQSRQEKMNQFWQAVSSLGLKKGKRIKYPVNPGDIEPKFQIELITKISYSPSKDILFADVPYYGMSIPVIKAGRLLFHKEGDSLIVVNAYTGTLDDYVKTLSKTFNVNYPTD